MDNQESTKKQLELVLGKWLDECLEVIERDGSDHIHVDEIMEKIGKSVESPIKDILQPYLIVVDLLENYLEKLQPVLCIPLKESKNLDLQLPNLKNLEDELSTEPPSISIVDRNVYTLLWREEGYTCPIDFQPFEIVRKDIFFKYKISMHEYLQDCGEEYQRTIIGEQYPDSLSRFWRELASAY